MFLPRVTPQHQLLKTRQLGDTLIHFFQHRAFQQWVLRARTEKLKDTWPTYKYPAKAYIYAFHEDQQYLEEKEKEQSLKDAIVQPRSFFRLPKPKLHPSRIPKNTLSSDAIDPALSRQEDSLLHPILRRPVRTEPSRHFGAGQCPIDTCRQAIDNGQGQQ